MYAIPVPDLSAYGVGNGVPTEGGSDRGSQIRLKMLVLDPYKGEYQVEPSAPLEGRMPPVPSLETAARSISSRIVAKAVKA